MGRDQTVMGEVTSSSMGNLRLWIGAALLVLAGLVSYAPLAHNEFINYDDPDYLTNNRHLLHGLTAESWTWAWSTQIASNWHPITWLSHLIDVHLFGEVSARGTHLENLAWHIGSSILLLVLLDRGTGRFWPSLLVAICFLLHPAQVETVAWGAQRKGVLSTFFGLACLGAYGMYVTRPAASARGWYVFSVVLGGICVLAKPTWVVLPLLLFIVDYWPLDRKGTWTWRLWDKIPFALWAALGAAMTFIAQTGAMAHDARLTPIVRIATGMVATLKYGCMTFWPVGLGVLYPHPLRMPSWGWQLGAAGFLVVGTTLAWVLRQRAPAVSAGWGIFLICLVPIIGVIQVGAQEMADRYLYLSGVGLFIAVAFGLGNLLRSSGGSERMMAGAILVIAAVLGGLSYQQVGYWRDTITLFAHTASVTQNNFVAYAHLSYAFFEKGDIERAEAYLERSVASGWRHPKSLVSLARYRWRRGAKEDARSLALEAIDREPRTIDAYVVLGSIAREERRFEEAGRWLEKALALDSTDPEAVELAAQLAGRRGREGRPSQRP